MRQWTYFFGGGAADGSTEMKDLLGGKGANLAEMTNLGMPVPPGFTIPTNVCLDVLRVGTIGDDLSNAVDNSIARLEALEAMAGRVFGDAENPLLVSVRSGARASMPGMMDTVLNLGLNDQTVHGLGQNTGSEWTAWDCYRRFVSMYGDVVLDMGPQEKTDLDPFDERLDAQKRSEGVSDDGDLSVDGLKALVADYKALVLERTGRPFPEDPKAQLMGAIDAVFRSWENERAVAYRNFYRIPHDWGTAVNVQAMVFGNMGKGSGTGVAFTRNSSTGERGLCGDFYENGQGEDVVAGKRTAPSLEALRDVMPDIYEELAALSERLEGHYRDMQDIEFTVEQGRLFVLQTRSGKRTGFAAARIAVEMVEEGLIDKAQALSRIDPDAMEQFMAPLFDPGAKAEAVANGRCLARGLPAGPGAGSGKIVFFADDAVEWRRRGEDVVLVRHETSPDDVHGMEAAVGFLTAFGGMSSHAALVGRQMGKVAVVGCSALSFDYRARTVTVATQEGPKTLREGEWISLDGFTGEVIEGALAATPSEVMQHLQGGTAENSETANRFLKIMGWSDEIRRLRIRANADQGDQAEVAVTLGAEGIGLCRTEHMFFGPGKIEPMQEMILASNEADRRAALDRLQPVQRRDFIEIFEAMEGRPVTIRTLDPPLHEFLPHEPAAIDALANTLGTSPETIRARVDSLRESNPMLGHRGCRLGITYPEITEMQARAIFEAACDVLEAGTEVKPEIMIPLVGNAKELELQADIVRQVADAVLARRGLELPYLVGTMIEVPRGALTATEIAGSADFFSFGTNDLTQTTLGLSRDDVPKVLEEYVTKKIFSVDPFVSIDRPGVGRLMEIAVDAGREVDSSLKIGICGEHGGDPASIEFCHSLKLDYVSCSPYRIPVARLAAAQAAIHHG